MHALGKFLLWWFVCPAIWRPDPWTAIAMEVRERGGEGDYVRRMEEDWRSERFTAAGLLVVRWAFMLAALSALR